MYPLISEYIESIMYANENFATLTTLRPVYDDEGNPIMSSGNFAVVFKMKDVHTGKLHAVKCFIREQEGRAEAYRLIAEELEYVSSTFLTSIKYLDNELFVDTNVTNETEFPVLLMDWVEGITLDKYIREHIDNQYELSMLAYQFSRLAMWLMPQPFAHGDLKPDNILVKDNGTLVLVDYDGMYVPAMEGQKARELGSPDFRHPSRTTDDFNEHIDDFSLISILLSIKAISLKPYLLFLYGASNRLLFSEKEYRDFSKSLILNELYPSNNSELNILLSLFIIAIERSDLSSISYSIFNLNKPHEFSHLAEVENMVLNYSWVDEFGVVYSHDKKILLKYPMDINLSSYKTIEECVMIGNYAFDYDEDPDPEFGVSIYGNSLIHLILSDNVLIIGEKAFSGCNSLEAIHLPDNLKVIGKGAFEWCFNLKEIVIPKEIEHIGTNSFPTDIIIKPIILYNFINHKECFYSKTGTLLWTNRSLSSFVFPPQIKTIGDGAFSSNRNIKSIEIPEGIISIGSYAFFGCTKLKSITLPQSIIHIGKDALKSLRGQEKYITYFYPAIYIPKGTIDKFSKMISDISLDRLKEIDDSYLDPFTLDDIIIDYLDNPNKPAADYYDPDNPPF